MPNPLAVARCVRHPHTPITQIAERQGSGKLTLSKGGASGTRVWQCPWFFYPAFCDWLLGRVAPNPMGAPQIWRPDVFSPCYPWLYAVEASVEGEDLLGVDLSLRAFYRRAVVTVKYSPLELNNSLHINSQMLTIPGSQFIFVGQNPGNAIGTQQTWQVKLADALGGTFRLGFRLARPDVTATTGAAPGDWVGTLITGGLDAIYKVTHWTGPIPATATPGQVTDAVRTALGYDQKNSAGEFTARDRLSDVITTGAGGAGDGTATDRQWRLMVRAGTKIKLVGDAAGLTSVKGDLLITTPPGPTDLYLPGPAGYLRVDEWFRTVKPADNDVVEDAVYRLSMEGSPTGTFQLQVESDSGVPIVTEQMHTDTFNVTTLYNYLGAALSPFAIERAAIGDPVNLEKRPVWISHFYADDAAVGAAEGRSFIGNLVDGGAPIKSIRKAKPTAEIRCYIGFRNLTTTVTGLKLIWVDRPVDAPHVLIVDVDPYLADRLDQNVGKVVPHGEITIQRHQVLASDMVYLLKVIGSVNMFTFLGFPPWTLLLSGIEAKQTRLPNGTPCFDMTFKFAFNPHTHQAVFRPAYMRWEFVRGLLVIRLPPGVAYPTNPLDPANSRVKINDKAVAAAYPKPKAPRVNPPIFDPRSGAVVVNPHGIAPTLPTTGGGPTGQPPNPTTLPPAPPSIFSAANPLGASPAAGAAAGLLGASGDPFNPDAPGPALSDLEPSLPCGTLDVDRSAAEIRALLAAMGEALFVDPADATDAHQVWESRSNILGDLMTRSIASRKGTVADDNAGGSGVAADIEQAREEGAAWIAQLDTGRDTATDGQYPGSGNPAADHAMLLAAHRAGATLTPAALNTLGLPASGGRPANAGVVAAALGASGAAVGATGAPIAAATGNPLNVGASYSPYGMSQQLYDLGLIYPICDFTPILFLQ